jgi:hypothetical protein
MTKTKKPLCKNCRLFNGNKKTCGVAILHEGKQYHLPVVADDSCFFEEKYVCINEEGQTEVFQPEVQQVRWWVEDPKTGQQTNGNGTVKIEYPNGFFGQND